MPQLHFVHDESISRGEHLSSLIDEAVAVLPEATTVVADPVDMQAVEAIAEARGLEVGVEAGECPLGGVVVVAEGRSVDDGLRQPVRWLELLGRLIALRFRSRSGTGSVVRGGR